MGEQGHEELKLLLEEGMKSNEDLRSRINGLYGLIGDMGKTLNQTKDKVDGKKYSTFRLA